MKKLFLRKEGHHHGCLLSRKIFKGFKEKEKFKEMVGKFSIHKSTIIFKINFSKLIEKYPKLKRSSMTWTFLKNYLKDIKKVREDNLGDFEKKSFVLRKLLEWGIQNSFNKLYCKIFKACVTSRRLNLVLTHFIQLTAPDFLECSIFKTKFVTQFFIAWIINC